MPNDRNIITEEPPEEEVLEEEPVIDSGGEYEEPAQKRESIGGKFDRGRNLYDKIKEKRGEPEKAKPAEPKGRPSAGADKAPSDVAGKVGKPIGSPKTPPVGGAGAVGAGAGEALGGAGTAVSAAGNVAGAAGTAGTAGGVAATAWWVILIIVIVLIILAIITFGIGFVVGLTTGGTSKQSTSAYQGQYSYSAPYISIDGKYFPITIKPQANFTKKSTRGFGDFRTSIRQHAGIDLIAPPGTQVRAITNGTVIAYDPNFYQGTGALLVDHGDFVINYGEIQKGSDISVGDTVSAGQNIGKVIANYHGSSMVHLEMYAPGTTSTARWMYGNKPTNLWDPTNFITELLGGFE